MDVWRSASVRSAGLDGPGLDPDLEDAVLLTHRALGAARTWLSVLDGECSVFKAATWPVGLQGPSSLTVAIHTRGEALVLSGPALRAHGAEVALDGTGATTWAGTPIRTAEGVVVAALQAAWIGPCADPIALLAVGGRLLAHQLDSRRDRQDLAEALEGRRLAAAELDSFFALSTDLLAVTDAHGVLRRINPAWGEALGRTRMELDAMTLADLATDADRAAVQAALASGTATAVEIRAHRADGALRDLHIGIAPLPGKGTRFLVARDVTHQNELARMKAAFIGTVTHELRSPMMSVHGGLSILARAMGDDDLSPRARELVEIAERSAARLVRFANDVLEVSRIESGRLPVTPVPVLIDAVFDEALAALELAAVTSQVRLDVERPAQMWVHADVVRAAQIVINLAGNAIKFSPPAATVRIACVATDAACRVEVVDQGPGIAVAERERVFAPFAQLPGQPGQGGAGLGLHIARELVLAHGGEIGVESGPAGGSLFWFTLRRAPDGLTRG